MTLREQQEAQRRAVPGYPGLTMRDLANALIVGAVRNGFIETLHAGRACSLLRDPSISRITDHEMKKLMVEASARLASYLDLLIESPEKFAAELDFLRRYTTGWEREALTYDLPPEGPAASTCTCGSVVLDAAWRFCPSCGRDLGASSAEAP